MNPPEAQLLQPSARKERPFQTQSLRVSQHGKKFVKVERAGGVASTLMNFFSCYNRQLLPLRLERSFFPDQWQRPFLSEILAPKFVYRRFCLIVRCIDTPLFPNVREASQLMVSDNATGPRVPRARRDVPNCKASGDLRTEHY